MWKMTYYRVKVKHTFVRWLQSIWKKPLCFTLLSFIQHQKKYVLLIIVKCTVSTGPWLEPLRLDLEEICNKGDVTIEIIPAWKWLVTWNNLLPVLDIWEGFLLEPKNGANNWTMLIPWWFDTWSSWRRFDSHQTLPKMKACQNVVIGFYSSTSCRFSRVRSRASSGCSRKACTSSISRLVSRLSNLNLRIFRQFSAFIIQGVLKHWDIRFQRRPGRSIPYQIVPVSPFEPRLFEQFSWYSMWYLIQILTEKDPVSIYQAILPAHNSPERVIKNQDLLRNGVDFPEISVLYPQRML